MGPVGLAQNVTGKGFQAFSLFHFCGGLENVKGPDPNGPFLLKLVLPEGLHLSSLKVKFSDQSTVLELASLVAKTLVKNDRAAEGDISPRSSSAFELSYGGAPVRRLSHELHAADEQEIRKTLITSVGISSGDVVRVTRL